MKLYVGNLNFSYTDQELETLFANVEGRSIQVKSAKVITDRETGRSKGFAFVEIENEQDAKHAMQILNNKMVMERALTVNEARPREEGSRGGSRGGYDNRRDGGGGYGGGRGGNRNNY